jgi:hypothetical protein
MGFVFCCAANGPTPTLRWIRTNGQLPPRAEVVGNELYIPLITEADQGTYRCMAANLVGAAFAQVTIIVEGPVFSLTR